MKTKESLKQLLLAESDLNRLHLMDDVQRLREHCMHSKDRIQGAATLASSALMLLSGWDAYQQSKSAPQSKNHSWQSKLTRGIRLATAVWQVVRSV